MNKHESLRTDEQLADDDQTATEVEAAAVKKTTASEEIMAEDLAAAKDLHMVLPLLPMRSMNVFPHVSFSFEVGRERSRAAVAKALEDEYRLIFIVAQRESDEAWPEADQLYTIGTVARVREAVEISDGLLRVRVKGLARAKICELKQSGDGPDLAALDGLARQLETEEEGLKTEALRREMVRAFQKYIEKSRQRGFESLVSLSEIDNADEQSDLISGSLNLSFTERQELLEQVKPADRIRCLLPLIRRESSIADYENELSEKVQEAVEKSQRDYFLREQLQVIRKELGEEIDPSEEVQEYTQKLDGLKLKPEDHEKLLKEIKRLPQYPPTFPEAATLRTYLDTVLDLPWGRISEERTGLASVRRQLDADHYGLEDVKERVLEYLAVRELHHRTSTEAFKAPILCLIGPPGVGKTSIAASIAKAVGREFVRMSLGGVKDEAEIRGHRRTYVGAIPGRIIAAIRQAKTDNPVILLDEVDKLGNDFRGDPASALLEVLDPEQNNNFRDHYLELPYDLSQVMFITTANNADTIPHPLLDRMEMIELSGYTEEEKYHIANLHLLPKQMGLNVLNKRDMSVSKAAILAVIRFYTREAGVRHLERELGKLCRKTVLKRLEAAELSSAKSKEEDEETGSKPSQTRSHRTTRITVKNLKDYLGKPVYRYDKVGKKDPVGVVTGLAWTSVGGDSLTVEVNISPGTGKIEMTGSLGDVMKESAKVSLAYIRSLPEVNRQFPKFPADSDLHIHVPAGAVPKDGPSAGVTLATAIYSALLQRPVRHDVAMTGEITIRGRVLPIGGLKEKVIAAHRAGVKTVLLPEENERDVEEIPQSVLADLELIPVADVRDVFNHALVQDKK